MLTATNPGTSIRSELANAGHQRFYQPIWHTLGFSNEEVMERLQQQADTIRANWHCSAESDKRFANWVALQTGTQDVALAFRGR